MIPFLDPILRISEKVIDRVWPDPETKAEALRQLRELDHKEMMGLFGGEVELLKGQLEINKMEAMHGGWFKGGWRPAVGWVCVAALAYKFLVQPAVVSAVQIWAFYAGETPFPLDMLPDLDWSELSMILMGMLGIGGYRTLEKYRTMRDARGDVDKVLG